MFLDCGRKPMQNMQTPDKKAPGQLVDLNSGPSSCEESAIHTYIESLQGVKVVHLKYC